DVQLLAGDAARAAYGEARPREGMTADEVLGQAELLAQRPHLVLEELAPRLDKLHVHAFRQAADIVVRLDRHGGPAGEGNALDDVRIEGALGEEIRAAELLRLFLEHFDEEPPDRLALL